MSAVNRLLAGGVYPAHPLALTEDLRLDEAGQRGLTRYYLAAGASGLAVGVHTTQFELHTERSDLLRVVLASAAEEAREHDRVSSGPTTVLIAGVLGETTRAVAEAELARELGYDAVLLIPAASSSEDAELERARLVGAVLPVVGFYLQPSVGGRRLSPAFWTRLADQESTVAVKCAPFDRYETVAMIRAISRSARCRDVALFTGNDDNILADLVTQFPSARTDEPPLSFAGGMLGQWAVWTARAVEHLALAKRARGGDALARAEVDLLAHDLTDANAAVFDVANQFSGSIAGVHEVLRRMGLMRGTWCLNPRERLSPGQSELLDSVWMDYPHLRDDEFVADNREAWLS